MASPKTPSKATASSAVGTKSRAPASGLKTLYLVSYNAASAFAWGVCLFRLAAVFLPVLSQVGVSNLLAGKGAEKVLRVAGDSFGEIGETVKWVQTAALLEILHVLFGIVRSGLLTTIMQVASRITMVWYICQNYPQVAASPAYASMVFAWSFTEVIRYTHYATGLLNVKLSALEWLRYSTFYLLYPVGAGSEGTLIYQSAKYAGKQFGAIGEYATYALLSLWPPSLAMMMTYMHSQRSKHVNPKKSSSTQAQKRATTTPPAKAIVAKLSTPGKSTPGGRTTAVDAGESTPARSTRSKSKAL